MRSSALRAAGQSDCADCKAGGFVMNGAPVWICTDKVGDLSIGGRPLSRCTIRFDDRQTGRGVAGRQLEDLVRNLSSGFRLVAEELQSREVETRRDRSGIQDDHLVERLGRLRESTKQQKHPAVQEMRLGQFEDLA